MAAAALAAAFGSSRQRWRSLLWLVPLVALWIALNYAIPVIGTSGVASVAARSSIHVMIALGLWLALERTALTAAQRRNAWLAVMVPFTLWLALVWSAAIAGAFRAGVSPLPLVPLAIWVPVIIGAPILLWSRRIGQVMDAMPASWLIALQVYRVLGSAFLVGWARGQVPAVFAFPAGIGDVTTGLLAVPVAIAVAAGTSRSLRAAPAWNVFGLLDFAVAIGIAQSIVLQLIVPTVANAQLGTYPTVMIPAFAVPSSILLHALSLRQLRRRVRQIEHPGALATPALA